jgi:hypothetical protein
MRNPENMKLPPGERDFSLHHREQDKPPVESSETPHLPDGAVFPLNGGLAAELLQDLAESALELNPEEQTAVERLYTRSMEKYLETKLHIKDILEDLRWEIAYFKQQQRFAKGKTKLHPVAKVSMGLAALSLLLAACGSPVSAEGPGSLTETAVSTQAVEADQATATADFEMPTPEATPVELADLNVDYGRYEGNEEQANEVLEARWREIADSIIEQQLALPSNIEIIDISSGNALIEALQTGREDDYPEGTTFTISQVEGFEGQLLTVTLDRANAVLSGNPAVELAISIDELPAALNAQGEVVAYVDPVTGQWAAGSVELAPEIVENVPQATATLEAGEFDFNLPEATMDNITEIPEPVRAQTFPLETTTRPDGSISRPFRCVADGIYTGRIQLTENVFSLASVECWYEVNGERRSIYVPLMFSDGEEMVIAGFDTQEYDPRLEELAGEKFWTAHLGNIGYTGPGHIFIVNADEFDPSLGDYGTFNGLGDEELAARFNDFYDDFGGSGNPDILGGVLPSWDVGMINGFNK